MIEEESVGRLRSEIRENMAAEAEGLAEEVRNLRPDMTFELEEDSGRVFEIVEFSCPYGSMTRNGNNLEHVFNQKHAKYQQLAEEVRRVRNMAGRVTVVIVSSLGAVFIPSLKELHKLLKCNDRQLRKLGWRMSEAAIEGSMDIWREYARNMNHERGGGEGEGEGADGNADAEAEAAIEEEINIIEEERESEAEAEAEAEAERERERERERAREGEREGQGEREGEGEGEREREGAVDRGRGIERVRKRRFREEQPEEDDIDEGEGEEEEEGERERERIGHGHGHGGRRRGIGEADVVDEIIALSELEDQ
jgi:hypothetical protein